MKRAIEWKSRLSIFVSLNSTKKLDIFAELNLEKIKLRKLELKFGLAEMGW